MRLITKFEAMVGNEWDEGDPTCVVGNVAGHELLDMLDCWTLPSPVPILKDGGNKISCDVSHPLLAELEGMVHEVVAWMEVSIMPQQNSNKLICCFPIL
jgi:hypothetical protein